MVVKEKVFTLSLSQFCRFLVTKHSNLYFKKKVFILNLSLISRISDFKGGVMAQYPPPKYATESIPNDILNISKTHNLIIFFNNNMLSYTI